MFLMLAGLTAIGSGMWLIGPAPTIYLDENGLRWRSEPLTLLDEEDRAIVAASSVNERRFTAYVEEPHTRLLLAAIRSLSSLPFVGLILGVGLALRGLGSNKDDPLAYAVPWLRRASIAAVLWTLAMPLVDSLTATALAHGLPTDDYTFYFVVEDLTEVSSAMLLAIAAYAAVWAVETGLRAQRDLAEIV